MLYLEVDLAKEKEATISGTVSGVFFNQMNCNKLTTIPVLSLLIKYKDFYFSLCCLSFYWTFSVD